MAEHIDDVLRDYLDQAGRLRPIQLGDAGGDAMPARAADPEGETLFVYLKRRISAHATYLAVLTAASVLVVPISVLTALLTVQALQVQAGVVLATVPVLSLSVVAMGRLRAEKAAMELIVQALRDLPPADAVRLIESIYWNQLWKPRNRKPGDPPEMLPSPAGKRPAIEYEDFDLRLRPGDGEESVIGASSSAGDDEARLIVPEQLARQAAGLTASLQHCPVSGPRAQASRHAAPMAPEPVADAQAIGLALFETLFPERIRTLYNRAYGRTGTIPGRGLRIRVKYKPQDRDIAELLALPWELLATPTESFLGRRRLTSFVRAPEVPLPSEPPVRTSPLKILALSSMPRGVHPLDLETELRQLEAVWERQPEVAVTSLEPPTLETLRERLMGAEAHVLHYMGHGAVDPSSRQGVLYFEDSGGDQEPVSGPELAEALEDVRSLRLVVINACVSAASGPAADDPSAAVNREHPFASVASCLVAAGVTAVVAMQFAISDRGAIAFSRALYRRLAVGDPLEAAVTEGRRVLARLDGGSLEWASPVLFLRTDDGRIFEPADA